MKRPLPSNAGIVAKAKHPKPAEEDSTLGCEYIGYSFQKDPVMVETWEASAMDDPKEFFQRFISKRKPCILQTNPTATTHPPLLPSISLQDLVTVAGPEVVQVEKRFSSNESFGQNRTKARQILMTIQELVHKMKTTEGELLYLSTQQIDNDQQQTGNDENDDDDDKKDQPPNPFQTPCAQLLQAKKIPPTLSWASTLRLESCNLWMGRTSSTAAEKGSNSGLHHDHHDNFYLLLKGRKQFRLYSPDTAHFMSTYGTIERIHFNGVISYMGSEMHADGTPVLQDDANGDGSEDENAESEDDNDDEEEVVLGKGFDYESDDEDNDDNEGGFGGAKVDVDGHDDFDDLEQESSSSPEKADKVVDDSQQEDTSRPNSFSRIDPVNVDQEKFPHFKTCKEYIVELTAGQILYLPAGWFHSVTSYSPKTGDTEDDDQVHMALNYWYHPPDQLDLFTKPYRRDHWKTV